MWTNRSQKHREIIFNVRKQQNTEGQIKTQQRVLFVRTVHLLLLFRSFSFFSVKIPDRHSVPETQTGFLISISHFMVLFQDWGFTSNSSWKKSLGLTNYDGWIEYKWLVLTSHVRRRWCNRKELVLSFRVCLHRQSIVPMATMIQRLSVHL